MYMKVSDLYIKYNKNNKTQHVKTMHLSKVSFRLYFTHQKKKKKNGKKIDYKLITIK